MEDLKTTIEEPEIGKAPCHDGIISEMIKYLGETGKQMLLKLLNKITRKNDIPSNWWKAIIMSLHIKGIEKECNNCKGISMLSIPEKVYKIILEKD